VPILFDASNKKEGVVLVFQRLVKLMTSLDQQFSGMCVTFPLIRDIKRGGFPGVMLVKSFLGKIGRSLED